MIADDRSFGSARVVAGDHVAADQSIVSSALAFADAVRDALRKHTQVEASFEGLKVAPSSYFNTFLQKLLEDVGLNVIGHELNLTFATKIQRAMFDRSYGTIQRLRSPNR